MKKASAPISFFLILFSVLLTPSCATLARGSKQRIPITSAPPGAMVIVNGVQQGMTPVEIGLTRKVKNQVIRIEFPGYSPLEIRPKRSLFKPDAIMNGFMGGMLGVGIATVLKYRNDHRNGTSLLMIWIPAVIGTFFAVDMISGDGSVFSPAELTVTLTKADGPPRVDTMLVDADDLRNVKWIRVHLN